jgi:hypothetical protein
MMKTVGMPLAIAAALTLAIWIFFDVWNGGAGKLQDPGSVVAVLVVMIVLVSLGFWIAGKLRKGKSA